MARPRRLACPATGDRLKCRTPSSARRWRRCTRLIGRTRRRECVVATLLSRLSVRVVRDTPWRQYSVRRRRGRWMGVTVQPEVGLGVGARALRALSRAANGSTVTGCIRTVCVLYHTSSACHPVAPASRTRGRVRVLGRSAQWPCFPGLVTACVACALCPQPWRGCFCDCSGPSTTRGTWTRGPQSTSTSSRARRRTAGWRSSRTFVARARARARTPFAPLRVCVCAACVTVMLRCRGKRGGG